MIDAHNALDVFLWLLLGGFVPALAVGLATLITFGIFTIPAMITDSDALGCLALLLTFVAHVAFVIVAFINLPWWLGLFGYTDSHLILMSYIVFVLGSSGLTLSFSASRR
ncbi:hypothetical protein MBO12_00375 [Candidatus Saccharibacteria bacterium]|nr:hypothetical protein [Candidatus Saccharibacteria bacterium]